MAELIQTRLLKTERIGREGFLFRFAKTDDFIAGQVVGVTSDPLLSPRWYSIASGEFDPQMSILFNVKSDGALTPTLAGKKEGDVLYVTRPQGSFVHKAEDAWFIATGTGIAPFRAMVRSGVTPLRLVQGGRTLRDLYFYEELQQLDGYVACVTGESTNGPPMRLTRYLEEQPHLPGQVKYYLCGNPDMVVDVRDLLLRKGILYENIVAEIYF